MTSLDERITSLDVALFDAVPSQTSLEHRESLLRWPRCVRLPGSYVYLEVRSDLGETLQSRLADHRCSSIYSIDKRPLDSQMNHAAPGAYP
jgi:hypothetical protein